jgi:hypothetical protein
MTTRLNESEISTTGNIIGNVIQTDNYQYANGAPFSGGGSSYGNSNVTTLLSSFGSNTISTTGNITSGYFVGNGSQLTGIVAVSSYGNSNVTTLLSSFGSNTISTTGNITSGYFVGNGSQLTGIVAVSSYGNSNVTTLLADFGSNTISTTGNITVAGNLIVQGNTIQIGNIIADAKTIQLTSFTGNAFQANGSGITVGNNDIATFTYGAVANRWLTNIGLDVVGGFSANSNGNTWSFNNNFMTAPSGAFWSSQSTTLDEYITSAPDGYINLQSLYANSNVASQVHLEHGLATIVVDNGSEYTWQFDDTGNLTLPGNTFAVNYANGNPVTINSSSYGNSNVTTLLSSFGSNTISTTGNITSGYFVGNGSQLTGIVAVSSYGNSNVTTLLADFGSNTISTTGNITSGNITAGNLIVQGKTIQLTSFTGNAFQANGSGITVGTVDIATFTYGAVANRWLTNIGLDVVGGFSANSNGNTWSFNNNFMTAPSGAFWSSQSTTLDEYITSAPDGYINLQSLYANSNVASQVHLEHGLATIVVDNGSEYTWQFDDTGNLTLPSGGNLIVSGAIVGSGASPAPSLSGFSSVNTTTLSATGNVSGNNISATTAFQLPVYANTTVRDAAISSPAIGMLIVVGNIYQGYNGSAWGNITLT